MEQLRPFQGAGPGEWLVSGLSSAPSRAVRGEGPPLSGLCGAALPHTPPGSTQMLSYWAPAHAQDCPGKRGFSVVGRSDEQRYQETKQAEVQRTWGEWREARRGGGTSLWWFLGLGSSVFCPEMTEYRTDSFLGDKMICGGDTGSR